MGRVRATKTVVGLVALAFCSLFVLVFNFTRFWGIHDLSNEAVDSKSHVDMETQLRSNLQSRAADLALQLKEERDKLLNTLVNMQKVDTPPQVSEDSAINSDALAKEVVKPSTPTVEQPRFGDIGAVEPPKSDTTAARGKPLPGAAAHPILSFDDETLKTTKISEMIALYGPTVGTTPGRSCEDDFGNGLVNRWRDTKETYCSPDGANLGTVGGHKSSIDCYLVKQTKHGGNGDQICVMENVGVNMDIFNDDNLMYQTVRGYESTKHQKQPYVKFPPGFVRSACETRKDKWKSSLMPGWNNEWTVGAVSPVKGSEDVECDEWIDEPVLIDQRDTFANFFHDSEDFVNVFLAMGVLEMSAADTQIYLTDLYPEGPFWDMWKKPFGLVRDTMTAWALKKRFGHTGKEKKTTCYKKLIVGIYGPASPLTVCSWDTKCRSSALVKAYSDFVIRGMGLQAHSHYASATPSKEIHILYMARRSSSQWPEKRFCDDKNSFFLCDIWKDWGLRSLQRTMKNEDKLLETLKELENHTFKNGAKVIVRDVDYNLLTFEDQIKIDLQTDIMIGPHGAGLMHSLFMRDRAALVELFVDGSGANRHFHNMAYWYGRQYQSVSGSLDPQRLLPIVRSIVEGMDLDGY